jgi:BirA family biotin operon repressor/biotin-[acetyl-CoA-carboxylase] ligase
MSSEHDLSEGFVIYTDYQTAGRGQQGNSWKSENRKNLLFSLLLYPKHIPIREQFLISQAVSIGIKQVLDKYVENISIKWPNDIFWNNRKIAGILIENSLQGSFIKNSIVGIGLNVNQTDFDALNAVSLKQITGKNYARNPILEQTRENILDVYHHWTAEQIRVEYLQILYRKSGYFPYSTQNETFEARIVNILPDGHLELEDRNGNVRCFYFKEVKFEI